MLYYKYKEVLAMKKLLSALFIVFCFPLFSCGESDSENSALPLAPGTIPPWEPTTYTSAYTVEEHIDRLIDYTENYHFYEEIENGEIVNYEVEVLYSFENHPKYYMIDIEYAEEKDFTARGFADCKSKYMHTVVQVIDDKYYFNEWSYFWFLPGKNPYEYTGNDAGKKYFAEYVYAVEKDGERVQIYKETTTQRNPVGASEYEDFSQKVLTEEDQIWAMRLAKFNFRRGNPY